jgi:hypothetical protein
LVFKPEETFNQLSTFENQRGVWVKAILCRRLWEFATTLLETWTSMHLGCGKRKKMNEKQVWTITF